MSTCLVNIYEKLNAHSRAELAAMVRERVDEVARMPGELVSAAGQFDSSIQNLEPLRLARVHVQRRAASRRVRYLDKSEASSVELGPATTRISLAGPQRSVCPSPDRGNGPGTPPFCCS